MQTNHLRKTILKRFPHPAVDALRFLRNKIGQLPQKTLPACLAALLLLSVTANATTYYISPSGSDGNNGTSTSTPWQTLAKVNSASFAPGDSVLFQGGQSFTGFLLFSKRTNVPVSSATNTITVGSYGTGAATIVSNTTGYMSAAVSLQGVSGINLTGLTILGGGGASPMTSIGVYILNVTGTTGVSAVTVQNCDISNFTSGTCGQTAEVFVSGYYGALANVNILNNNLHGANGVASPDCNGIIGTGGTNHNVTNVTYSGNTIYNLGGMADNYGGGIVAANVNGGVVQYNVAHDIGANSTSCGGPCGIWAYDSSNVTIQFNEVYNVTPTTYTTGCDWNAYDLDGNVTNSVVQYNYSHNNAGAAWLAYMEGTWGNNIFRFNISENDDCLQTAGGVLLLSDTMPTSPVYVYNNTMYSSNPATSTKYPAGIYGEATGTAWPAGSCIVNNIFYDNVTTANKSVSYIYFPYAYTGLTLANNIYYTTSTSSVWAYHGTNYTTLAAYQTASGWDANSFVANPLLSNPGTGGTLTWTPSLHNGPQPNPTGYALRTGSPAFGAGINLTTSPYNFSIPMDYYGNAFASAIGAAQSSATGTGTPFVTAQTTGTLANDYTGSLGYEFTVGSSSITVYSLGRWVVAGNTGSHLVKLSSSSGDVAGGSVTINTSGATAGQYLYANLASPVVLSANTTYVIVSHEVVGGDQWYSYYAEVLTHSSIATIPCPVLSATDEPPWSTQYGVNKAYIPLNFTATCP